MACMAYRSVQIHLAYSVALACCPRTRQTYFHASFPVASRHVWWAHYDLAVAGSAKHLASRLDTGRWWTHLCESLRQGNQEHFSTAQHSTARAQIQFSSTVSHMSSYVFVRSCARAACRPRGYLFCNSSFEVKYKANNFGSAGCTAIIIDNTLQSTQLLPQRQS